MNKKTQESKNIFCPVCERFHRLRQVWFENYPLMKKADGIYIAFCPENRISYISCFTPVRLIIKNTVSKKLIIPGLNSGMSDKNNIT